MMTVPRSHFAFAAAVAATGKPRRPRRMGSVDWGSAAAARTDPLCDWLRMRALASRMCLLARPARAQAHWAMPAWALLRLELCLLFRVRQVADILGKPPLRTYGYVFQSGSACMQGRWPVP
jgi:hypothetical protein